MKNLLSRNEKTFTLVLVIVAVPLVAFFSLFFQAGSGSGPQSQFVTAETIDYRMARPDQAYSEYNLSGREIEMSLIGLVKKKVSEIKDKFSGKKEKMIAEQQKKEQAAKKQAAQKKEKAKTLGGLSKTVTRTETDAKSRSQSANDASTEPYDRGSNEEAVYGGGTVAAPAAQPVNQNTAETQAKSNKKTVAEWQALLLSAPTAESLSQLLSAFRKNELTMAEYQALAQTLLSQESDQSKALGLMALRAVPSLESLSQLVYLDVSANASFSAYVQQSINAYLMPQNIQYLNSALSSLDRVLISKSLVLLNENLSRFLQGDLSNLSEARNLRDGRVAVFSIEDYRSLIPALQQLGASPDSELSGLAQQVAAMIQTTNNVASN